MKHFTSAHSCAQNNVKEHSPIHDLQAYKARQRKIKRQQILKNTAETSMYFCAAALTFSMLFWGV